MKRLRLPLMAYAFLLAAPAVLTGTPGAAQTLDEIMESVPAENRAQFERINKALIRGGTETIGELCSKLAPMGAEGGAAVRYAVNGLAKYASEAGGNARPMVASAMLDALEAADDAEVKTFLMEQLQLCGGGEAVEPLSAYLLDAQLVEPAAMTLAAIGGEAAGNALLNALPDAENKAAILKAIGDLQLAGISRAVMNYAGSGEEAVRHMAWRALAESGDFDAARMLEYPAQNSEGYEQTRALAYYRRYAERLAELEEGFAAGGVCRKILEGFPEPEHVHIRCGALSTLVDAQGPFAFGDLLKAVESGQIEYRVTALKLSLGIPGEPATQAWIAKAGGVEPVAKSEIVRMLGKRGDPAAIEFVTRALRDKEPAVRREAITALRHLAPGEAASEILYAFRRSEDPADIEAVLGALLLMDTDSAAAAIEERIGRAEASLKAAMMKFLEERRVASSVETVFAMTEDEDASVRLAAISALGGVVDENHLPRLLDLFMAAGGDAASEARESAETVLSRIENADYRDDFLVSRFGEADDAHKAMILKTLANLGGGDARDLAIESLKAGSPDIRGAALDALANWTSLEPAEAMLAALKEADGDLPGRIAQSYIELVAGSGAGNEEQVSRLAGLLTALDEAGQADLKPAAIEALSNIRHESAVDVLAPYLDDESLREAAAAAIVEIVAPGRRSEGLKSPSIHGILKKIVDTVQNEETKTEASEYLQTLPEPLSLNEPDAEGFVPLFNNYDLTGWIGDTSGYPVRDGIIHCENGGNIFVNREFSDFVLRFEFKLTPGANNGLGIRVPEGGHPSYDGMELQILDNTADQYKNLRPYQYHGSVYGVIPAKRGFLKPVGEWNAQEVTADGKNIKVVLNGETIVDGNLLEAADPQPMDGNRHPGIYRDSGRIGFLGHGTELQFRNIRIKTLEKDAEGS